MSKIYQDYPKMFKNVQKGMRITGVVVSGFVVSRDVVSGVVVSGFQYPGL